MTSPFRLLTTALTTVALSALAGPGCGPGSQAGRVGPDKLLAAQKARGASLKGEAVGLVKTARRR